MEKQLWVNIKTQIDRHYSDEYSKEDIKMIKSFFKSGWNVYPESGYMFQRIITFSDGSRNENCIDIDEARRLFKNIMDIQ